jgi:WD40 repeat protein
VSVREALRVRRLEELAKPAEVKKGLFGSASRPTSARASTREDMPLSPSMRPCPAAGEAEGSGLANAPAPGGLGPLPWLAGADLLRPDEIPRSRRDPPEDVVEPAWLHGCRAADVRSHLKYGPGGSVLFFSSAIAVQMAKARAEGEEEEGAGSGSGLWQQKFVFEHDAPITCMAYCAGTRMVATADCTDGAVGTSKDGTQQQRQARIVLWDAETTTSRRTLEIPEVAGIRYLDFSSDGARLLALSMDARNTLFMYHVDSCKLLYSVLLGDRAKVMALSFAKSPSMFSVAGSMGIEFYTEEMGGPGGAGRMVTFNKNQALFHTIGRESKTALTNSLCAFELEDEMVSGNSNGSLILWRGRNCVQVLRAAHEGPVLDLHYSAAARLLVSGGVDGKIKLVRVAASAAGAARKGFKKAAGGAEDVRLLEIFGALDVSGCDVLSRQIRSVCMHSDGSRVLVGTKSGEVLELSALGDAGDKPAAVLAEGEEGEAGGGEGGSKLRLGEDVNGGPILKAHWDNSPDKFGTVAVWALCRVSAGGFLSAGSDYTVRRWQTGDRDVTAQREVGRAQLDSGAVCIACSAASVAVGLDGLGNAERSHCVLVLALEGLKETQSLGDAAGTVRVIQFSPDGSLLACGADDGVVYVYALAEGAFGLKGRLEGLTSPVTHMDFSACGQFLRGSEEGGILYWDVAVSFGALSRDREALKALAWASATSPYTWDAKGSFSELVAGESITCVDRSNHLVVSGLSSGAILLTRLPNVDMGIDSNGYRGVKQEAHCGRVSALCYIDEGARLVTAGAEDGLIQVWRVMYDFDEGEPEPEPSAEGEGEEAAPAAEEEEEEDGDKPKIPAAYDSGDDEDLLDGEDMEWPERVHEGNVCLKPGAQFEELTYWMKSVGLAESSTWSLPKGNVPDAEMSLDWVYGYSSRLTRASVRYTIEGGVAYPAATLALVLDKKARSQLHAMNHQGEVSCLDVHPSSGNAVTAQRGKGHVFACVWSTASGVCRGRMDCGRVHGASAVAFSPDGTLIAVACQDFSHSILIFDWEHNVLRTRVSGGAQKVLNVCFSLAPATYANGLRLMQGGVGHFQLLELKGRQLTAKRGLYGAGMPKRNVLCSAALPIFASMEAPNEFVVGMSDGSLGVVARGERKFTQTLPLTAKAVTAVCVMRGVDDTAPFRVVTGSVDGHVKIVDHNWEVTASYNVYSSCPSLYRLGQVRGIKSICVDRANRKILFGTAGGEIGELNAADGADVNKGPLVSSHCRDFVSGLSAHPLRQECATVGGDKTLRIWNLERHSMSTMIELSDVASAVCYSPNAQLIAVGLGGAVRGGARMPREHEGELVVVSYLQGTLRIVFGSKDAAGVFNAFVFSPEGSELYAASEDGKVYVYDVLDDFKLIQTLVHHTTGVRGLDVSEGAGRFLCSSDADNMLAVWDTATHTLLEDKKKNEVLAKGGWLGRTVPAGLDTLGIYQPHIAMQFVTSLHRSSDKKLVVTSDCAGGVSLYSYPCSKPGAPYKEFFGHSAGGVALARFTCKDDYLITIGSDDKCLFQWRLNKSTPAPPAGGGEAAKSAVVRPAPAPADTSARPLLLAQHTNQYNSFAHEEAAKATVDEECLVPTGMGGVEFCSESDTSAPDAAPALSAVLGMGGVSYIAGSKTALPLAHYCGSGQVVSAMGSLVYTFDSDRYGQAVWKIPEGQEVGAVAVSHDLRYVLVAEKPSVGADLPESPSFFAKQRIFAASTGSLVKSLPGTIIGGVCAAAFSSDGLQAACLSCDYQHSVTLYNTPQVS